LPLSRLVRILPVALAAVSALCDSSAFAGGMAYNANFTVLAEDQALAQAILDRAEQYRRQVAVEWLGTELPPSVGRARITQTRKEQNVPTFTWTVDRESGGDRKEHSVYISGEGEELVGPALCHEVAHVVFATQFAGRLPAWIDEGIASRYDDEDRKETRRKILDWYARSENWPRLKLLVESEQILAQDQASYSVAASVVEYLLSLDSREKLLEFAQAASREGCDAALRRHYKIGGVEELQSRWQAWAAAPVRVASAR
jgi:hypothetical protein